MALHLADQIVDAVVVLVTGLTTTGARVFADRDIDDEPFADGELPGLTVNIGDETDEPQTLDNPSTMQAVLNVGITVGVKLTTMTAARKQLNLCRNEIQKAIAADRRLGGKCERIQLAQAEYEFNGGGDKPMATVRLVFQAVYLYYENTPDV